jgi:antirestriction protein ArdC
MRERQLNGYEVAEPDREPVPPADAVATATELLREQTEAVLSSDGFAAYLRMLGKFHRYSFSNVLLIMAQRPDATLGNSYRRWQALGRHVRKGERGIRIFYPRRRRPDDADAEPDPAREPERVVTGFGVASVFDVAQTEGDPLPEPPSVAESAESSAVAAAVNKRAALWLVGQGLRLESRPLRSSANGWYNPGREPKEIVIKQADPALGADPLNVAKTRTLLHEMAHVVADHRSGVP